MGQEDKDILFLLFKDLCARLLYGVKCFTKYGALPIYKMYYDGSIIFEIKSLDGNGVTRFGCDIPKPYLRPMSSMTKKERKEYKNLVAFSGNPYGAANFVDWLNKKMFAYRIINDKDMFELGLALEAPKDMYK